MDVNMDRISSTPNISLLDQSEGKVSTSLLDNWHYMYQRGVPPQGMARSSTVPTITVQQAPESGELSLYGPDVNFNINLDDLDCPGQPSGRGLCYNSSLSSLCDSSVTSEDDVESRARSMSLDSRTRSISVDAGDEAYLFLGDDSDDEEVDTSTHANSVRFMLAPKQASDPEDGDSPEEEQADHINNNSESEEEDEEALKTPRGRYPSDTEQLGFFRLKRRASFDNGVYGLPDRIASGEVGAVGSERNALTAPATPAEPSTPVGRFLSEEELMLDPEQVFNRIYNLLCAERVTQMTKTYNDIEAVTRLLEEKERDLELAARIGQTLLGKNKELNGRGEVLEDQLTHANEKINQLKHDLSMKDELLRFYCQDLQDESSGDTTPSDGIAGLSKINIEMLQRKVGTLEEENLNLRLESAQLRTATDSYEEKEKKLVEDCLEQLAEVNSQVETFAGELRLKSEESLHQKEEITNLLAQVADLHKRVRQLTIENMDLAEKLQASQESQRQLTKELSVQHDKYDELFEMLEQAQDELRGHRNRHNPRATRHNYLSSSLPAPTPAMDSLASELQNSLIQQAEEDEEEKERRTRSWKVFETARAARKAASKSSRDSSVRMSTSTTSSVKDPFSQNPSNVPSDNESMNSDGYSADMDSMYGSNSELGRPGIPGSNDLESALRRLASRRANEMNERDYLASFRETRSEGMSPFRMCDTPDSISSPPSGYSYLGVSQAQGGSHFKLPDKLQIVKPLEGSVTLRHWQRLAQPHLGGLFEQREGVQVRGERKLDLEGEVYTLSDFEEDDEVVECPSRRMADSSTIYTYTNSMVSCPSELGLLTPCPSSSSMSSGVSTPRTSTPRSRTNNTSSTYSMSLGLAAILEGREGGATRSLMRPVASCPVMADGKATSTEASPTGIPSHAVAMGGDQASGLSHSASVASAMGSGLFGKLMSTGYSLLWNKTDTLESSADSLSQAVAAAPGSPQSPTKGPKSAKKPTAGQILPKGGSTGVLGAIASFRKNGML